MLGAIMRCVALPLDGSPGSGCGGVVGAYEAFTWSCPWQDRLHVPDRVPVSRNSSRPSDAGFTNRTSKLIRWLLFVALPIPDAIPWASWHAEHDAYRTFAEPAFPATCNP